MTPHRRHALTLLELLVVLMILAVLAAILVPLYSGTTYQAQEDAAKVSLRELQGVIANRYLVDMRGVVLTSTSQAVNDGLPGPHPDFLVPATRGQHPQIAFLFVNPLTNSTQPGFDPVIARGWRGPYVLAGLAGTYPGVEPATASIRGFDATYGEAGDTAVLDPWGNPIVIQGTSQLDAVLVSAGPDGSLFTLSDNLSIPLR